MIPLVVVQVAAMGLGLLVAIRLNYVLTKKRGLSKKGK